MMKGIKIERNLWRDAEITSLLTIIEEKNVLQMMNTKQFRNEQIFRFIETEMHARGFVKKNYQQIWTKWKFLKSSYVTTRRHNSLPGNNPRTCDYYFFLDRILGKRPTIASVHSGVTVAEVDLLKTDDESEEENLSGSISEPMTPESSANGDYILPEIKLDIDMKTEIVSQPQQPPMPPLQAKPPPKLLKIVPNAEGKQYNMFSPSQKPLPSLKTPSPLMQQPQRSKFQQNASEQGSSATKRKKPIGGNYSRAMRDLTTNIQTMQNDLMQEFFHKQEELMREEHAFQRQQDAILLRHFENQTRMLLNGVRNLFEQGAPTAPHVVYLDDDNEY